MPDPLILLKNPKSLTQIQPYLLSTPWAGLLLLQKDIQKNKHPNYYKPRKGTKNLLIKNNSVRKSEWLEKQIENN